MFFSVLFCLSGERTPTKGHSCGCIEGLQGLIGKKVMAQWNLGEHTHTHQHLHTLPFLKGERSVSRGNGEPLLWLITQQGPGRTQCHFHCQTHYTTEEDSPLLLSCPFSPAVMWRNPSTAYGDELSTSKWKTKWNVLNTHNIFSQLYML